MISLCHGQLYHKIMKKSFDKKVKPLEFREGDLVLKRSCLLMLILGASELLILKAHMLSRNPSLAVH